MSLIGPNPQPHADVELASNQLRVGRPEGDPEHPKLQRLEPRLTSLSGRCFFYTGASLLRRECVFHRSFMLTSCARY